MLLVLKLKAASDREYRITHGTSHDIEWERGKIMKDRADILALLDPGRGGRDVNISFLGEMMQIYPFLAERLGKVALDREAVEFYGHMGQDEAKKLIELALDLLG